MLMYSKKLSMTKKAKYTTYSVGDLVWLNDPAHSRCKLAPRWKGPYIVTRTVQPASGYSVLYAIQPKGFPEKTPQVVHHNRLKPYLAPTCQLGRTVSDASSPIAQPVEKEVPSSTSNSNTLAAQENLPSVVFTGGVPNQSSARSLLLGQPPLNLTQNTGQFNVPQSGDTASSKVDRLTSMAPHAVLDSRPLGHRPFRLPARFKDFVVK